VGRHKKFAFSLEGGGVKKVFNPYFPHLPTPLPINNDHSLKETSTWEEIFDILLNKFPGHGIFDMFEEICDK
jgi:hypothetical protein